mmetsp:Transcript_4042/g.11329  ORF Transcript_4042/g.11329 Transcript_4042/m.11329 type:complete len:248 (-) Transcript_4042:168-911(-)
MDGIESHAVAAEKALHELQTTLQASVKDTRSEKQQQVAIGEKLAQRVRHAVDSYRLEIKALSPEKQIAHLGRARDIEAQLKTCRTELDWKRFDIKRNGESEGLFGGGGSGGVGEDDDDHEMSLEQTVAAADRIQDAGEASLLRTRQMAVEAETIGISTLEEMHKQEEQLDQVAEDMEDVKANIKRSKKILSQIAKSAANDRCIKVLCVLIVIALLVMIVLAITGRDGGSLLVPDQVRASDRARLLRE